jgi:membrane fusion protein (multidrug efflux system)
MDASLLPVSLPARGSFVARNAARAAPVIFLAGLAAYLLARNAGLGTGSARGFSESLPLNVASPTGGRIAELVVRVGQLVKAGDPIVKLDGKLLEAQRQENLAEQALLQAKVYAVKSLQEDAVMRADVWRLRTVANASHDEAALNELNKEVARLSGLLDDKLIKASEVEPRIQARDALAARVSTFARARAAGQAGLEEKSNRSTADQHHATIQLRIAPEEQALRVNEAALAQIDLQIAALTLRAPADGVVAMINRRPGEILAPAEAAVTVVAHRPGVFEIYVPARERRIPTVGATVEISNLRLLSRGYPARVIEVGPAVIQLPEQLWTSHNVPAWGRRVLVDASDAETMRLIPAGEEIRARI